MFSQKKAHFCIIWGIFVFFLLFSIGVNLTPEYHYEQKIQNINITSGVSLFTWSIFLTGESSSLVFSFPKGRIYPELTIVWENDGNRYVRDIDKEDIDETDYLYTFPLVTQRKWTWKYNIYISENRENMMASIIQNNLSPSGYRMSFFSSFSPVSWKEESVDIVSRKDWWADESLRYWNETKLQKQKDEWEARWRTPEIIYETRAQKEQRLLERKRQERIEEIRWDAVKITSVTRYEWGKKLLWPIKKTKIVDRIILHHTAENLEQDASDETIMRAIFSYHARTRWWWDIGYNYVVGQRGKIYEWRAGGDYTEWAHAYANNLGSVWISVMGNFEVMSVNRDQKKWLEWLIVFLAKKYGINISEKVIWVRSCKNSSDCLFDENIVSRLHGHRDVGYTTCSGKNLYMLLDELRSNLSQEIWTLTFVRNQRVWKIEKLDPQDMVEYRDEDREWENVPSVQSMKWWKWKKIKIKLSYPVENSSINLSVPLYQQWLLILWKKRVRMKKWESMEIHTSKNNTLSVVVGKKHFIVPSFTLSSPLIRIDSWTRIPLWDTSKQYNDNVFRSALHITNQNGKLIVVNEIPIEDYLKGLWEVSNTDPSEKIKTIIVAARSYALYYTDKKNRKYSTNLYDGSDDPDSFQRYLGYSYETRSPNVGKLVDETRWEVITYLWNTIKAWYFSSSHGKTLSYEEYCKKSWSMNCMNMPYLQSVDDPWAIWKSQLGHWVWISGIWATHFALEWWNYKKIIAYYLKWVEIQKK